MAKLKLEALGLGEGLNRGARWIALAIGILVAAIIAGGQIANPDPRVLQVIAAGLLVLLAFRSKSISALMLAVLFLPFPKATSYGNTNVAFILLIFIIWLFRVSRKQAAAPQWTRLDLPVIGLVMAYALSFYNVHAHDLARSWAITASFFTYLFLAYMVINIVRTSEDVKKIFFAQTISSVLVCLIGLYEVGHPSSVIVPGWIELNQGYEFARQGVRIGSSFLDFELFAEYCGLNLLFQIFLFQRATSKTRKFLVAALMGITLFCLFATVTRGAIISLTVAMVYLVWISRRRVDFVRLVTFGFLAIGLLGGADFIVSHYTRTGSVMERLMGTELEGGVVPETRAGVWKQASENVMKEPIIGHGPFYAADRGLVTLYWPHCLYLYYAYIVGFVGLAFFLWILAVLWRATKPRAPSPGSGTYVQGATVILRAMLVLFIVDQIKIEYLRNERYSFFIWFLFGLMIAVDQVAKREAAAAARNAPAAIPFDPVRRSRVSAPPAVSARPAVGGL